MTDRELLELLLQKMTSMEQKIASLDQKATSTEQKIASLDQKATSTEQKIASLDQKATSTEQKIASLNQKATSTEQKIASLDQKVTFIEQKIISIEQTAASKDDIVKLEKVIGDIIAMVEVTQKEVKSLRNDINTIEAVTAKNWTDIVQLKSVKQA